MIDASRWLAKWSIVNWNSVKFWLKVIVGDLCVVGAFYAWLVLGFDGANKCIVFLAWLCVCVRLVVGFFGDKSFFEKLPPRPAGFARYHLLTDMAFVMSLVYLGYVVLPSLFVFSFFVSEAARDREPKAKGVTIHAD